LNFVADIFHFKSIFEKRQIGDFDRPFRGVRDNTQPWLMARWKAHMRLPISDNWAFLAICYGLAAMKPNAWKMCVLEGGGLLRSPILGERGRRPPTTVWWQKTRRIALSCGIKISPVGSLD